MSAPALKQAGLVTADSGFERIKQYPGDEQVRLKVVVEIPGSWFGSGALGSLTAGERRERYEAQAVEYTPLHEFKKPGQRKSTKEQAIRFICISDAAEDADHPGFWISVAQWNRYRHDTYKERRSDELPFIVAPSAQLAEAAAPAAMQQLKPAAAILTHFEKVKTGAHVQQKRGGGTETVTATWYRCTQPGCRRRADQYICEVGKSTGNLFRELKRCNNPLWRKLRLGSKHSKTYAGADGEEIELMPFKEALPHYVRFVKWCVQDWQPFRRSRSKAFRTYVQGLNQRAGLPHRETCIKILGVLRTLTDQKIETILARHRCRFAEPFAGATSDIWSTSSCRSSFFCMRLNVVLEPDVIFTASSTGTRPTTLTEVAPMIAFREFKETKHSGQVIAAVKRGALAKFGMTPNSLSLLTEDGASNNKSSAKLLKVPFMVCAPHNLQRAVLFGAGEAGSTSKNPELKQFIARASKMASAPHRSTKASDLLQKAQMDKGTPKSRVLATETANVTRWTGLFRMAHKVAL